MRNRFHEPRPDVASHRRLDDVSANKSLYGNKRETPSIRCHESANRTQGWGSGGPSGGGGGERWGRGGSGRGRSGALGRGRAPWAGAAPGRREPRDRHGAADPWASHRYGQDSGRFRTRAQVAVTWAKATLATGQAAPEAAWRATSGS